MRSLPALKAEAGRVSEPSTNIYYCTRRSIAEEINLIFICCQYDTKKEDKQQKEYKQ